MKSGQTALAEREARRRSRWPVLAGAAVLLWPAWWYCRGDDQGLFFFAAGLSAMAFALPRAFRGTTRWVVWTWLAVSIACFAANVVRLVPPEPLADGGRELDRLVTAFYGVGMTALLFRPGALTVTLTALGCLPMIMVVLGRGMGEPGAASGSAPLIVWIFVALVCVHDQVQCLTRRRAADVLPPTAGDVAVRAVVVACVCVAAFLLRLPIERVAVELQRRIFGLVTDTGQGLLARRGADLSLGQTLPQGFEGRLRVVLLIRAARWPGYLRESVYTVYKAGRWLAPRPGDPLRPLAATAGSARSVYPLMPPPSRPMGEWRVEVLEPRMLAGFCLPGGAGSLICDESRLLQDTNGAVTAVSAYPERYELRVVSARQAEQTFPLPDGFSDETYLSVPPVLAQAVSNWVAACEGLAQARSAPEAGLCVRRHFETGYAYRLGIQLQARPDPLADFMRRREGACVQFASAAALMLRSCGYPARVVGGYVCCGWNPWLDRWVVRERDGHAWVEVWDGSARRWILVDPTPAEGQPALFGKPGRLRLLCDWLAATWRRLVYALKNANPLLLIADTGALVFSFLWQTVTSPAGLVVLAGFSLIVWLRRRVRLRRQRPVDRLREELAEAMRELARRAVPGRARRRVFESWDVWLSRIKGELPEADYGELCALTEAYQELRYRVVIDEPAARAWIGRARAALRGSGSGRV